MQKRKDFEQNIGATKLNGDSVVCGACRAVSFLQDVPQLHTPPLCKSWNLRFVVLKSAKDWDNLK